MTIFDDREHAMETKFFHDQDQEFHILCRRDKLFGRWAAQEIGLTGDAESVFVRSVIDSEIVNHGVIGRVSQELAAHGHAMDDAVLNRKLQEMHELAREQVFREEQG